VGPLGRVEHDASGAGGSDRLHVGRALPEVLGRSRLGRARPNRVHLLVRAARELAGRVGRASIARAYAADTNDRPGSRRRGPRARARRSRSRAASPVLQGRLTGDRVGRGDGAAGRSDPYGFSNRNTKRSVRPLTDGSKTPAVWSASGVASAAESPASSQPAAVIT